MNKNDLLNRLEILYPDNPSLADLRRAYVDRDLSSIFRLLETVHDTELGELRRAVMQQNKHSVFRLLEMAFGTKYDDFRKAVLENNQYALFRYIEQLAAEGVEPAQISDLRKAVLDDDLFSLFRAIIDDDDFFVVNLRKAMLTDNLYSLFKLVDTEHENYFDLELPEDMQDNDVKKFVLQDNTWAMFRVINELVDTQIVKALKSLSSEDRPFDTDALSQGQLNSKVWLIEELSELDLDLGTVFLCAGWYGILATLMFENNIKLKKIRSFDIDPDVAAIAEYFNRPWVIDQWKFKAVTADIHKIDFKGHGYSVENSQGKSVDQYDFPDTVINTSCEHIDDFDAWYDSIPDGTIMILQSNDFDDVDEHVNTRASLEDFALQTPMTEELFSGELNLVKYTRFMRIGIK